MHPARPIGRLVPEIRSGGASSARRPEPGARSIAEVADALADACDRLVSAATALEVAIESSPRGTGPADVRAASGLAVKARETIAAAGRLLDAHGRGPVRRSGSEGAGAPLSVVPVAPAAPALRIELFGGLRVERAGRLVPDSAWKRRKARDIFAQLVHMRGRSISRSRLVDLYWPDVDADAGHANLRVTISAIRKAAGDVVKCSASGYRFVAPETTDVDADAFERDVDAARTAAARGDVAGAERSYRRAAGRYGGDFLDGMDDGNWQWPERERLRAAYLEALRALVRARELASAERRELLDRILTIAPFDLEAVRVRLDDLVRRGRADEARREYAAWRARYHTALGEEPALRWDPPVRDLLRSRRTIGSRP